MPVAAPRLSRAFLITALAALLGTASLTAGATAAAARTRSHGPRPHVWVKTPRPWRTVSGSVPCHVVAHDRHGIRKVRFSLDGRHLNTRLSWPYNCKNDAGGGLNTRLLSDGRHRLALRVWNWAGRSRLVRFPFWVNNSVRSETTTGPPRRPSAPDSHAAGLLFDGARPSSFDTLFEAASSRIQVTSDPLGGPQDALRFRVFDSDVYPATPTDNPRAQAISPSIIHSGMEFWVNDSFLLPSTFPSNLPWDALLSIYGPPFNSSSPVCLAVNGDQILIKRNRTYGDDAPWHMPLVRNRWVSFRMHERFGRDGWIELWIDGQRVTFSNGQQRLYMATMDGSNDQGANAVRIGNYFSAGIARETTVYHRGFKVGLTSASVTG